MARYLDLITDIQNPVLIELVKIVVKRVAAEIVDSENPEAAEIAWAKRANFEFGVDRSQWYASRAIEGMASTDPNFLALLDAYRANQNPDITDDAFSDLVEPWIRNFIDNGI
jgi:hypothetical protein